MELPNNGATPRAGQLDRGDTAGGDQGLTRIARLTSILLFRLVWTDKGAQGLRRFTRLSNKLLCRGTLGAKFCFTNAERP